MQAWGPEETLGSHFGEPVIFFSFLCVVVYLPNKLLTTYIKNVETISIYFHKSCLCTDSYFFS